jgi:hypothetical protein
MKTPLTFLLLATSVLAQAPSSARQPVVFIDANGAEQEPARQTNSVDRDDQTIELARELLKSCPEISLTRKDDVVPDYSLLLNRGQERGFVFKAALSRVMLLDSDKNVLYAGQKGTLAKAAKDGCKAIIADWKAKRLHERESDPTR